MNKVILVGRLGKDPDCKKLGTNSCSKFSLATSESYYDKTKKEKVEKTEWHNVVTWGKLAEVVEKYYSKGTQCLVEGKLSTSSYDNKQGVKIYRTEIVASSVKLLGNKSSDETPREDVKSITTNELSWLE